MNDLKSTFLTYWLLPFLCLIGTLIIFFSPLRFIIVPQFVVYHTFLEAFCIVISLMIFMTQFVLRNHSTSGLYQVLGIPYLGIGIIDLLHTLSFEGVPDFVTPNSLQKSISFWLAARFLEAGTFLFFALSLKYKWNTRNSRQQLIYLVVLAYTVLVTIVVLWFPEILPSFSDTLGHLSAVKKGSEYLLIFSHLVILYLLISTTEKNKNHDNIALLIAASSIIAISGLCFSSFSESNDLIIFTGHVLKAMAYYFIFKAALQSELLQPYKQLIELNNDLLSQTESLKNIKALLLKSERLNSLGMNAGIALHDLNNMVQIANIAAKKILKLVSGNSSAESIRAYSNTIVNSLAKTQKFQQQLLQQVKSSADKVTIIELHEELTQFSSLLKTLVGSNELVIDCEDMLNVEINQVELEQVLMNLVINARDAIKSQDGKIIIRAKKQTIHSPANSLTGTIKSGNYIKLSVIDNGRGVPAESLTKIFEPFYTTKESSNGTGLGLSAVKTIIEKWNAYLQVHTISGKGTEFDIFINEIKDPL